MFQRIPLFRAGDDPRYAIYRIPGLVVTPGGALLATCEARRRPRGDWGATDIMLRRSLDGQAWSAPLQMNLPAQLFRKNPVALEQGLAAADEIVCGSPLLIAGSDAAHFLYCVENQHCFYRRSDDDGLSWSEPREITAAFDEFQARYPWRVFALGPGHGIQLSSGRLVAPAWLSPGSGGTVTPRTVGATPRSSGGHRPSAATTIFSDDGGASWQAGEIIVEHGSEIVNPSETALAELPDGRVTPLAVRGVMANIRSESAAHRRLVSISPDGAGGWSAPEFDPELFEPVCFASLACLPGGELLFCNPDSRASFGTGQGWGKRENLTVRLSRDGGQSWPVARVIDPGLAGYADLGAGSDGRIYCLYEGGGLGGDPYSSSALWLACFNLEWLRGG